VPANNLESDIQFVFLQRKIKQLAKQMIKNSKQDAYTFLEMLTSIPEKYADHDLGKSLLAFINSKEGDIN
jgi:hypothetical protein